MTLKDWKKTTKKLGQSGWKKRYDIIKYTKKYTKDYITMVPKFYGEFVDGYEVTTHNINTIVDWFETKALAISYAKDYMRHN